MDAARQMALVVHEVWLRCPGAPATSRIDLGAGGWLVLPAGFDLAFGPLSLTSATAADPRGEYGSDAAFSSRRRARSAR